MRIRIVEQECSGVNVVHTAESCSVGNVGTNVSFRNNKRNSLMIGNYTDLFELVEAALLRHNLLEPADATSKVVASNDPISIAKEKL